MEVKKTSEKVLLWLHRNNKSNVWLAGNLGQTRQSISQKIKRNEFTDLDIAQMIKLGFKK